MMKLHEIFAQLEEIAPVSLSDECCKAWDAYDNSGVILNTDDEIRGVLFSLDLTSAAVEEAVKGNYNLIVTHHPAIYCPVKKLDGASATAKNLVKCAKNGISVISMHLNFDCAAEGIDHYLMRALGGGNAAATMSQFTEGGYGRVYGVKPVNFTALCKNLQTVFNTKKYRAYGYGGRVVRKIASFCGAGADDKTIAFAKENGVDVFVSADMKHHQILDLLENGINVVELTHYASENYGFEQIYKNVSQKFTVPHKFYTNEELL